MRGQGLSPSLLTPYGRWKLGKKFHKLFTSALPFSILGGGSPQKAHISPVFLYDMSQWFYSVISKPAASTSLGNLLEIEI